MSEKHPDGAATKACPKCGVSKQHTNYYKSKRNKDGLRSYCIECTRAINKEWHTNNLDIHKAAMDAWVAKNKERNKAAKSRWHKDNKERLSLVRAKYFKHRFDNDIDFRLRVNLRARLNRAIKNNQKTGSAVRDLGCTISELKLHLESQFQPGMNWDNYSHSVWHIDHIIPISAFNLTDRKQLLQACHYTNLQPLWAKDNISKSNKMHNTSYRGLYE